MVSIRWCCKQKEGIKLIDSNENLVNGYLKMAEDSLGTMIRERKYNIRFSISACYYSMYYSLYAVFMKIGIKCEIHTCSLEIMKRLLTQYYSQEYVHLIKDAFNSRNIVQYYIDKVVSEDTINRIILNAPSFLAETKEILSKINEENIIEIREEIKNIINKK